MYRTPNTTLIGEALVRFSKTGDFELTVSKGPGIALLSLRQDATFAEVKGGLARQGWSGPVGQAPPQLRGWLGLRDQFLHAPDRKTLRYALGNEIVSIPVLINIVLDADVSAFEREVFPSSSEKPIPPNVQKVERVVLNALLK